MSFIEIVLSNGKMSVSIEDRTKTIFHLVGQLANYDSIDVDMLFTEEIKDGNPDVKLFLQEKGDYLVFQPSFSYKGYETRSRDRDEMVVSQGDKVLIVHRNRDAENAFIKKLQNLHSNFIYNEESASLA